MHHLPRIRIRKPATICFSSLFWTFIILKAGIAIFFLAYRCILNHFINVCGAIREVQTKRAENTKPRKAESDSAEPVSWEARERGLQDSSAGNTGAAAGAE